MNKICFCLLSDAIIEPSLFAFAFQNMGTFAFQNMGCFYYKTTTYKTEE